ncbi:iron ABC transporter permease [Vibrio sp. JC009]|uniref:FecCD family ABC transporter permease n=1 Tax=Vibrio sp. JC009 TaxID=2912314 RepID=UPI0023B0977B|nr:iron ABC transporter permease [Vibrio sp. JC009]WED23913.1 iron ABC transporter permease [Vibrio sp. JC009]
MTISTTVPSALSTYKSKLSLLPVQIAILASLLLVTVLVSLGTGRYPIDYTTIVAILSDNIFDITNHWNPVEERVIELVRLPRIVVAGLVGAALSVSGAVMQGMFRNPLVGPNIIGVSSGAAFGGVLAIMLMLPGILVTVFASVFGLGAIIIALLLARSGQKTSVLSLVLGGVITGGFFSALVSLAKYVADPDDVLPEVVYWLLGSFNNSNYIDTLHVAIPLLFAGTLIYRMRHTINILSLGEEEAVSLGIDVNKSRLLLMLLTAILIAASVSVSGVIGWVGLIIPHFARMICGPNHSRLIPVVLFIGAIYMILADTLARTASYGEIPIGVLTALMGAPVFGYLLRKIQSKKEGAES